MLFMFGFFCRSDQSIEISRWVLCEVICENYHMICLLWVCYSKGMFSLCVFGLFFQSGGEGGDKVKEGWVAAVVAVGGKEIHWPWGGRDSELNCFFFIFFEYVYSKAITVTVSHLAVIMISDFTKGDFGYQQTVAPTPKTIHMGQRTPRPCPSRVSDIAVKWSWHINIFCFGEGNGEVLWRVSCIAMVTNILKY